MEPPTKRIIIHLSDTFFITLPIGIASAERSFSVLWCIKNYMRSKKTSRARSQHTSDLAQLAIERDIAQQLDIIKQFSSCKVRRGMNSANIIN